jgi:hypothetical protein
VLSRLDAYNYSLTRHQMQRGQRSDGDTARLRVVMQKLIDGKFFLLYCRLLQPDVVKVPSPSSCISGLHLMRC